MMIRIRTEEKDIHKIFGFDTFEQMVEVLADREHEDNKRLTPLLAIFITLIEGKSKEAMLLSFLLRGVVEAFVDDEIDRPTEVIKHLNGRLSADKLHKIFVGIMTARKNLGMSQEISLKDLMRKDK